MKETPGEFHYSQLVLYSNITNQEVLALAKNVQMYIELKDPTNETIMSVGNMIREYGRAHITVRLRL